MRLETLNGSRASGCVRLQDEVRSFATAFQHMNGVATLGLVLGNPMCQREFGCLPLDTQSLLQVGGEIAGKRVEFFQ